MIRGIAPACSTTGDESNEGGPVGVVAAGATDNVADNGATSSSGGHNGRNHQKTGGVTGSIACANVQNGRNTAKTSDVDQFWDGKKAVKTHVNLNPRIDVIRDLTQDVSTIM